MIKSLVKKSLDAIGYELRKKPEAMERHEPVLYSYVRPDGSFDYERYVRVQTEANQKKLQVVFVLEENIAFLSSYLERTIPPPKFGICHGTRRGNEQSWFRKYLGCEVIGTEISETADSFPHTIRWDFHEVKPEWLDAVDFIYSNSFDHSYAPEKCLNAWMSCVKKGGVCILEHSTHHGPQATSEVDPFGVDLVQLPYLITLWGNGAYGVRQILQAPKAALAVRDTSFVVIQKF